MALRSTQPLTDEYEVHFLGAKGGRCVRLTTLPLSCAVVMKSGNLNFLEPSGPLSACNGTDLPFNGWYCLVRLSTYLLTPWCRVLLKKLTGLQLVKKFTAFHGTRRFITALTSVRHLSLSSASLFQSIYPHPTSWRSILILCTDLRLGLPSGLFPSVFPIKTLYTPLSSPVRATCPAVYQHIHHYTNFSSVRGLKKRDVFFFFFLLQFLGEFAKLRKAAILVFVMFARPHGPATRLPPNGFS